MSDILAVIDEVTADAQATTDALGAQWFAEAMAGVRDAIDGDISERAWSCCDAPDCLDNHEDTIARWVPPESRPEPEPLLPWEMWLAAATPAATVTMDWSQLWEPSTDVRTFYFDETVGWRSNSVNAAPPSPAITLGGVTVNPDSVAELPYPARPLDAIERFHQYLAAEPVMPARAPILIPDQRTRPTSTERTKQRRA